MPTNPTIAQPWGDATVSLARQMSQIMTEIESLFGARDNSFLFMGWEFEGSHPQIRHSESGNKHVVIGLSMSASEYYNTAVHELAHECIHLLSPVVGMATNLEEGLATWYADTYYRNTLGLDPGSISESYVGAFEAVVELFEASRERHLIIRRLRSERSCFSDITARDILACVPDLEVSLADFLVREWDSSRPDEVSFSV